MPLFFIAMKGRSHMNAIETHDLTVQYPSRRSPAIAGVSLTIPQAAVTGLLGPNGAGKSTLVHAISTVIPMTSGDAAVLGHSARRHPDRVRQRIGLMTQVDTIDWGLTVGEQIEFEARLGGLSPTERRRRVNDLMERFGLASLRNTDPIQISGGQAKRMQLCRALMMRPPILFLDEPTLGLDPLGVDMVLAEIRSLTADGTTVVLATNEMDQAAAVCDRVLFIREGACIAQGTPAELAARNGGSLGTAFRALATKGGDAAC